MEDYDDCLPLPDKEGRLDIRYRGWNHLDDTLWTMGKELISLNISYNNLETLPPDIGNLLLLKDFDCSFNKLQSFPSEMGKLKRLVRLKCNGNKLRSLPQEISKCKLLEEINCSENELLEVPPKMADLPTLKVLMLQRNKLKKFNVYVGCIPTIEMIDLSYNPGLTNDFPEQWLNDTKMIVWICKVHMRYQDELEMLKVSNREHEDVTRLIKESKLRLQDQLNMLKDENRRIVAERPESLLIIQGVFKKMSSDVRYQMNLIKNSKACVIG